MKVDLSNFTLSGLDLHNVVYKDGGRAEVPLHLEDTSVQALARDVSKGLGGNLGPLRFASVMVAEPTDAVDQYYHADSDDSLRTNAFVYLTSVEKPEDGALDIEATGPVLGPRGTLAHYPASALHRGLANRSSKARVAIAMAFSESEQAIQTIGGGPPTPTNTWWILLIGNGVMFILGLLVNLMNRSR